MNLDLIIHDSYTTPGENTRRLQKMVPLGTRIRFYWSFFKVVMRSRKVALANRYGYEPWAAASLEMFRLIERFGGRFHINGAENLTQCKPPVVLISNHMSTLETMIFPFLIAPHMKVTFVVKESLVSHRLFGPIMRSRNPIVVSRANSREDLMRVMNQGQELLKSGVSIIIFPQSTRKAEFVAEEFNSLGTKLAGKAGVQVIPIAIKTDFWVNGKHIRDLGPLDRSKPIHINFGAPMEIHGNGREEHHRIVEFIQSHIKEWADS